MRRYNTDMDAIGAMLIVTLLCLCISGFMALKLARYTVSMTAGTRTWARTIDIETYSAVDKTSARSSVEPDAYAVTPYTTCTWIGKFYSCTAKVRYKVNRWVHTHTLRTTGQYGETRFWPDFVDTPIAQGNAPNLTDKRGVRYAEHFYVTLSSSAVPTDQPIVFYTQEQKVWDAMPPGSAWDVTFNRLNEPIWSDLRSRDMR